MLTPALLDALRSDHGQELLLVAAALADDPFAASRLRDRAGPELAAAAVDQIRLRRRAAAKFVEADRMWFERSLLEQASGTAVAAHRAQRYAAAGEAVADLCCGLGGDTLGLAREARVVAVDRDLLARALTEANAAALGLAGAVTVRDAELPDGAPGTPLAWMDPGRREGGRRTRSLEAMSPPLSVVLSLAQSYRGLGVKLAPATDHAELDRRLPEGRAEREFLSVGGECRELALWLNDLAGDHLRRATLLPGAHSLAGSPMPLAEIGPAGGYLLEPDAAVLRAGLVGNLAAELNAWGLDPLLCYLSTDERKHTPFARTYRITEARPFSLPALSALLRAAGAGDVTLKTRGVALEPEALRQRLRQVLKQGRPDSRPVVFITRVNLRPVMMLGEFVAPGPE